MGRLAAVAGYARRQDLRERNKAVQTSAFLLPTVVARWIVIGRVAAVITRAAPAAVGLRRRCTVSRKGRTAPGDNDGRCRHALAFYHCEESFSIRRVQTDAAM